MPIVPISDLQFRANKVRTEIAGYANSNSRVGGLLLDMIDTLDAAAGGGGDVNGPVSSIDANVAVFDGTTGKLIKDGGQTIAQIIAAAAGGGGDVHGPSSSVDLRIAVFDLTTGKIIKDGGQSIAQVIAAGAAAAPQGDVVGPASAIDSRIAVFDTTTGKLIKDGGTTIAAIANGSARSVFGRSANTAGVQASIAGGGAGTVLIDNGTTIGFSTIVTASITDANVTYAKIANGTGLSVIGRSANTSGVNADITGTSDQVLCVNTAGTALGFSTIATGGIAANAITLAKLATQAALSVLANATNATAVPSAVAASVDGQVFLRSGTTLAFGTIATAGITNNAVTLAKLATQAALSVLANATNATAVPSAVAAASDGQVFLRSGTTLAFGTIATAGYTDASVTYAKIANGTGLSVIGRSANTSGVNADITGTSDQVLCCNTAGTALAFSTVQTGGIAANAITLAKLATQAALSVLANGTNATAVPTAIAAGTDHFVFVRSSTTLTWALLVDANIDPAAAVAGTKISPNFGSQTVITTGTYRAGTNPSTTGGFNLASAATLSARNAANSGDISLIASNASDAIIVGDASTSVCLEHAYLASARDVVSLFKAGALTTTEMPSNTGSGVGYLANATTEPTTGLPGSGDILWVSNVSKADSMMTKNPAGGFWSQSPEGNWHRYYRRDSGTTSSTASTVVATISLGGLGNGSGSVRAFLTSRDATNSQGQAVYGFGFSVQGGSLISGTTSPTSLYGSDAVVSSVALAYPGSPSITFKVSASDGTSYTHEVLFEVTFHPNAA